MEQASLSRRRFAGAHAAWRRYPLGRFVLRRLLAGMATLFVVSILVFAATELLPGDTASAILGRDASGEQLVELRRQMGLDRPALERYGDWVRGLLAGDLGNTAAGYAAGGEVSIWSQIEGKVGNSLVLAGATFALAVPLALLLAAAAATRQGRPLDHGISIGTLALISLPEFVLGSLLILVFFAWLDWLPPVSLVPPGTSVLSEPDRLVLPILTLLGVTVGAAVRMIRAGLVDVLRSDYVQLARMNRLRERRVMVRYALRNALAPSVQVFAVMLQYLIGGIIIVEFLFAYRGIGKELVDAVAIRDVREVQSITILLAATYILINIVADLIVVLLVPKLRTAGR